MGAASKESKDLQREIASRLLLLREVFHGNNASAAGRSVQLTPQAWYNYETGRRSLDLNVAKKLCEAHEVDFNWLIGGSDKHLKKTVKAKLAIAAAKLESATNKPLMALESNAKKKKQKKKKGNSSTSQG
jgi:hypothetical protein